MNLRCFWNPKQRCQYRTRSKGLGILPCSLVSKNPLLNVSYIDFPVFPHPLVLWIKFKYIFFNIISPLGPLLSEIQIFQSLVRLYHKLILINGLFLNSKQHCSGEIYKLVESKQTVAVVGMHTWVSLQQSTCCSQ